MKVTVLECQWADSLHLWAAVRYHQYCQMREEELLTPTYARPNVELLKFRLSASSRRTHEIDLKTLKCTKIVEKIRIPLWIFFCV